MRVAAASTWVSSAKPSVFIEFLIFLTVDFRRLISNFCSSVVSWPLLCRATCDSRLRFVVNALPQLGSVHLKGFSPAMRDGARARVCAGSEAGGGVETEAANAARVMG